MIFLSRKKNLNPNIYHLNYSAHSYQVRENNLDFLGQKRKGLKAIKRDEVTSKLCCFLTITTQGGKGIDIKST